MTIYKPKKLKEAEKLKSVSLEIDRQLLRKEGDVAIHPFARRKRPLLFGICILMLLALAVLSLAVGVIIYKRSLAKSFCGVFDVNYRDPSRNIKAGMFKEKLEIDGKHEKLLVPEISDYLSATILHDFESNYTSIVDVTRARCYIMPLNRTLVEPPKNLMDLIGKFKSGYYAPNVEILRDSYLVDMGTLVNPEEYGSYIHEHCMFYDVYKIQKNPSRKLLKRSSPLCPMEGDTFCLGSTLSGGYLPCISLSRCF